MDLSTRWPPIATATVLIMPVLAVVYIYGAVLSAPPIRSDGAGYYIYLPALFIDRDLTFMAMAVRQAENIASWGANLRQLPSGVYFDRYPVGPALLQIPFFAVAHTWALITKSDASGFSTPYQVANVAAGIFYFWVGAAFVFRTLRLHFDQETASAATLALIFGTSLFHLATCDSSFSHVYSFCLMAVFVWALLAYKIGQRWTLALIAGTAFGLIVISRNSNVIAGILALAVWIEVRDRNWWHAGLFMAAAPLAVTPQLLYWWIATGSPIVYSYEEVFSFRWTDPRILEFLFSIAKGFFFWAPVSLLSVVGLVLLKGRLAGFAIAISVCLALQIYICSSWHDWSFGGGFGSRPMVDFVPVLAIPMAAAIEWMRSRIGRVVSNAILVLTCLWTVVLMHSYWIGFVSYYRVPASDIASLPQRYKARYLPRL